MINELCNEIGKKYNFQAMNLLAYAVVQNAKCIFDNVLSERKRVRAYLTSK